MRSFDYVAAADVRHAVTLLAEHGTEAKVLAGGTDLLADLKASKHGPRLVIDISRMQALKKIVLTDEGLRIGSLATHAQIMRSELIQQHAPVLADAAHTIGAVQTRNLGTLGGNLVTAVPSMDSGPALLALDARVVIAGSSGERQLALGAFFKGPRQTMLKPDELLTAIVIPAANLGKPVHFLKSGLRKGQALALVNAASGFRLDSAGRIVEPRIALGAVAPTIMRVLTAEDALAGCLPTSEAFAEAGSIAAATCRPISDFRASAAYRRDLVAVLVRRTLASALADAKEKRGD